MRNGSGVKAATRAPSQERRRKRKELSGVDQEFLNLVRSRFQQQAGGTRGLGLPQVQRLVGLRDRYLSRRLFAVLDEDGDGRISEADFLRSVISVILGEDEAKLRFVFRIHDADDDGKIQSEELDKVLSACLRQNRLKVSPADRRAIRDALLKKAGAGKEGLTFAAFRRLISGDELVYRQLVYSVSQWFGAEDTHRVDVRHVRFSTIIRYLAVVVPYYAWRGLLILAYVGANAWFAWQAATRYAASGANVYIQVARAAGACLNFNGMLILFPMMRVFLSWARRTFLAALLPVDHAIGIHKAVGTVMMVAALVHTGAHMLNYTTLAVPFEQSLFHTTAGLSGVVLLAVFAVMWLFAQPFVRRTPLYGLFALTHTLYWVWFAVFLFHARSFIQWAAVPVAGFVIELLVRNLGKKSLTLVKEATAYPTGATHLVLQRPARFRFDAGEYLYLRLPQVSRFGWHPFTISSGPEESGHIGLHIRALGNWTRRLHRLVGRLPPKERQMPAVVNGPYGSPSERIFTSKHAVLIGAGIGVTPFASILRSIAARRQKGEDLHLEKVYFFWLYRGQSTYEWFSDLLADLQSRSLRSILETNIYLTDTGINPTTGLLTIGMDLVQKRTHRDPLTGLQSRTRFGRPDWNQIFYNISSEHPYSRVNVFFCGPYPLGRIVRVAARQAGFHFRMEQF